MAIIYTFFYIGRYTAVWDKCKQNVFVCPEDNGIAGFLIFTDGDEKP